MLPSRYSRFDISVDPPRSCLPQSKNINIFNSQHCRQNTSFQSVSVFNELGEPSCGSPWASSCVAIVRIGRWAREPQVGGRQGGSDANAKEYVHMKGRG